MHVHIAVMQALGNVKINANGYKNTPKWTLVVYQCPLSQCQSKMQVLNSIGVIVVTDYMDIMSA